MTSHYDLPPCVFRPVAAPDRADSSLPILPVELRVAADGSALAVYDGVGTYPYPSVEEFREAHGASWLEIVDNDFDPAAPSPWLRRDEDLRLAAEEGDGEALEMLAEARYLEILEEAFPLGSLCDLGAPRPEGLAAVEDSNGRFTVRGPEGEIWCPGEVARVALAEAYVKGEVEVGEAVIRLCDQAPGLGVWRA